MKITTATYGDVDCLAQIKSKIKNDKLVLRVDNNIIGDPKSGQIKFLITEIDGQIHTIKEGSMFTYPKSTTDRLGIWYSNNINTSPVVNKSLETIHIAAQNKADIVTSVWHPIHSNPFPEFISWTKTSSHLNQLLQIMQCLYNAKNMGNYKYVSFLEHDVLYPVGYFDFPDFDIGNVYTNMNYGGLNKNGWQKQKQHDQPMHQMTMRFEDALAHVINILPNAVTTNSGLIESQTLTRCVWNCNNEAIHVNHGNHFTSHYTIYTETTQPSHIYWGDHKEYQNLF